MLSTRLGLAVIFGMSVTASSVCSADQPAGGGYAAAPQAYGGTYQNGAGYGNGSPGGGYPVLNAPLYPAPVQYVPEYAGGSIITNQAFSPHEMLYPHSYHAMYPPFYYRVKGHWLLTPFGVRQHENWKLEGTHVKVKYRDHYRLFSQFHPPVSH